MATTAIVKGPTGEGFLARVTELRPNSILLAIDRPLQFRDRVKIDLLGTELDGEVVFAADREAAITFKMSPEIFDLIEAVESNQEPPAGATGESAHGVTDLAASPPIPEVDPSGVFDPIDDVETLAHLLALWTQRPIVAKASHEIATALLRRGDFALPLRAVSLGSGLFALSTSDRQAVELAVSKFKVVLDRFVQPRSSSIPAAAIGVPPLGEDGKTVEFSNREQFAVQHRINIEKGALVVNAAPLPPGTKRDLQLVIPGAAPITVSAQVMFQGPGTLGFSIVMNDALKASFKAVLDDSGKTAPAMSFMDVTGSTPVPAARATSSARLSPAIGYRCELAAPLPVEELAWLSTKRPKEVADAKGSYLRVLDFLLASEVEACLQASSDEYEICLWLYRGRVVFSTRKPEKQDDLIGRRLIASRVATRATIDIAVPEISPNHPLGTLLVEQGKITQEQLNRELRQQILDRACAPCSFTKGSLQVLPWTEPAMKAKLLPVAGRYLLSEAVRSELKRVSQEDLTKGMSRLFELELRVDLDGIDTSLRLGQKELRFYQRIAQNPAALATVGTTGGAGPSEGLRLAVIGCALGFARLGKVDRERIVEKQRLSTEDILLDQLQRTEKVSAFEVLGIHWSASPREIRTAYDNERKKLMMRKREDESTRDLVHRLERRLDEALKTLNSTSDRKALREASGDALERQHAAEHLVQQAEIAMFREEYEVAADLLDSADELCATVRRSKQLRARLQRAL